MAIFVNPVDGDIVITKGRLRTATLSEEVQARILKRLLFLKGAWFLDILEGNNFLEIFKTGSIIALKNAVREIIEKTPNVEEVVSLSVDFDRASRKVSIQGQIKIVDGSTIDLSNLDARFFTII